MKLSFLRTYHKFIIFLLGVFGFSTGCRGMEYGVPSADFILNGNIKSAETEEAIKDIQVSMNYESTTSDENGNFTLKLRDFPEEQTFTVYFDDIDGELNGLYQSKDTTVTFPAGNYTGESDNWHEGETSLNITVKLDEAE